jgi:hypothetical protein
MINYSEWRKISESVLPIQVQNTAQPAPSSAAEAKPLLTSPEEIKEKPTLKPKVKPWKAGKDEIMKFWKSIAGNLPLALQPIPADHKGTTIQEDGIRITGSKEFIASVLSRLKDFLTFENPNEKLVVSYRQSPKSFIKGNRNSYSFYLQVKDRGKTD